MLNKKSTRRAALLVGITASLLVGLPAAVESDDRELLRTRVGKPYIFILLDNSASMTLDPNDNWLPANGARAPGVPDFERYDDRFDPERGDGELEIWVPLAR